MSLGETRMASLPAGHEEREGGLVPACVQAAGGAHMHAHMHAHTHAPATTRTRTHTQAHNALCAAPSLMAFWKIGSAWFFTRSSSASCGHAPGPIPVRHWAR